MQVPSCKSKRWIEGLLETSCGHLRSHMDLIDFLQYFLFFKTFADPSARLFRKFAILFMTVSMIVSMPTDSGTQRTLRQLGLRGIAAQEIIVAAPLRLV